MPLLFDAFNIFSRKSRLASCAVSLASVSAAPAAKTASSSSSTSGPSTLEVIAAPEVPEVCTIHVEVGAGSECRETVVESKESTGSLGATRKSPRSPRRQTARHALLKCSISPPQTLRRSSGSVSQVSSASTSGHRRKRSSSTSSIAEKDRAVIAFPTSVEMEKQSTGPCSRGSFEDGEGWVATSASEDARPPRKRARRSAVSLSKVTTTRSASPSRCKQERSLSSSLGLDGRCPPPSESHSSPSPQPPSPRPTLRTRSPSPPVTTRTNFTRQQKDLASMYHTLVMHHEITIPAALEDQRTLCELQATRGHSELGLEMKSYLGKFDEAVQEELKELDGVLLTRIYLRLLLSRVPVAPLQHDQLRRTKESDGHGVESDSILDFPSASGLGVQGGVTAVDTEKEVQQVKEDRVMDESPWLGLEDEMDVDETRPPPSSRTDAESSSESSPPPTPDVPQWVGPPYSSLSALIVDLTLRYRHRAALESRRRRNRPRVSKSSTKSRLGLASFTLGDLVKEQGRRKSTDAMDDGRRMDEALDGMGMMDVERMDVDLDLAGLPEDAVRSTFAGWEEADEEEVGFGRRDAPQPVQGDSEPKDDSSPPQAGVESDTEFDSDSDDDAEWKRLRIELVSGSSASNPPPTPSRPIPIRPPSPPSSHLARRQNPTGYSAKADQGRNEHTFQRQVAEVVGYKSVGQGSEEPTECEEAIGEDQLQRETGAYTKRVSMFAYRSIIQSLAQGQGLGNLPFVTLGLRRGGLVQYQRTSPNGSKTPLLYVPEFQRMHDQGGMNFRFQNRIIARPQNRLEHAYAGARETTDPSPEKESARQARRGWAGTLVGWLKTTSRVSFVAVAVVPCLRKRGKVDTSPSAVQGLILTWRASRRQESKPEKAQFIAPSKTSQRDLLVLMEFILPRVRTHAPVFPNRDVLRPVARSACSKRAITDGGQKLRFHYRNGWVGKRYISVASHRKVVSSRAARSLKDGTRTTGGTGVEYTLLVVPGILRLWLGFSRRREHLAYRHVYFVLEQYWRRLGYRGDMNRKPHDHYGTQENIPGSHMVAWVRDGYSGIGYSGLGRVKIERKRPRAVRANFIEGISPKRCIGK
ncbi:hypothetical protein FA13DRAFT_1775985 [Coprinellus micaceus]|uniref:Uncharacterized protein n=1 Tax=Coprinellus micaceus TaxID=71717 RepID=A0A4Y7T325_COPMI|nr:hypothetical protein FA13DRAFT_1775985 [Coprinellus micaceus]